MSLSKLSCLVAKSLVSLSNPWTAARQAPLSSTISWSLLRFICIESMMLSNYLILCYPFLLLPSVFHSVRSFPMSQLFTSGGQSSGASTCPSNEYSEWISFGIDWFDLLVVQGTLKSLLQHPSLKASICWH